MTDQFKDGFVEKLLEELSNSTVTKSTYKSNIEINNNTHWLVIESIHWEKSAWQKEEELFATVAIQKYNTFHWHYCNYINKTISKYDDFGASLGAIRITTTKELNDIITSFKTIPIRKNPWMIYSKVECTICKEDKDHIEMYKLRDCSHSFCMSCLDKMMLLPHKQHRCPLCRKRFHDHDGNSDGDDEPYTDEE